MFGATVRGDKTEFRLWAPNAKSVNIQLNGKAIFPMERQADGVFFANIAASAGDNYGYKLDDQKPLPDPVSRLLPEGVHGPSEIVDPNSFLWTDQQWRGLP